MSLPTIVSSAQNRLLITLDQVKLELGITDSDGDDILETYRRRASQAIVSHCDREFARDSVIETRRNVFHSNCLILENGFPDPNQVAGYSTIDSIVVDGVTLTTDQYEFDARNGTIYRLMSEMRAHWFGRKITVAHTTGYICPDDSDATLPEEVQGAALELIKAAKFAAPRDPLLRSESILSGLYDYTLFDPSKAESAWPASVVDTMDRYRNRTIG